MRDARAIYAFLLRSELRGRFVSVSAVLFLAVNLFLFYFSLSGLGLPAAEAAPPVLWITYVLFLTTLVSNLYQRLAHGQFLPTLSLAGAGESAVFLAIVGFVVTLALALTLLLLGLFSLFFSWHFGAAQARILGVFFLASFGLAATGVLVNELLAHVRLRDVVLPIVYFPLTLPLLMAAVHATVRNIPAFDPGPWAFLVGIDLILFFSSFLLYDFAKEELT